MEPREPKGMEQANLLYIINHGLGREEEQMVEKFSEEIKKK
jgi:hypothetical protein